MGIWKRYLENSRTNRGRMGNMRQNGTRGGDILELSIDEESVTAKYERTRNVENVEEFNKKIMDWGMKVRSELQISISANIANDKNLSKSLKNTYHYEYGEIYRLGFTFKPEGVYVHKGVGRGYNMRGDIAVRTAKQESKIGKLRKPKPWFNPVVERNMPELVSIIKSYTETAIINTARIYIK